MKIKIICFCFLILALIAGYFWGNNLVKQNSWITNNEPVFESLDTPEQEAAINEPASLTPSSIPSSYQIKNVAFASQAPFANWDHLHDEACEEASLVIVNYFLTHQALSNEKMEEEIQKLTKYEEQTWGDGYKNLSIEEEKTLAENFYSLKSEVKNITNISELKKEISENHLIIVPAAGRLLNNPNFRSPGPLYHMLVVTGYNEKQIITNDVGTRKGHNFVYPEATFWNALHDWPGSENNIMSGAKTILVF